MVFIIMVFYAMYFMELFLIHVFIVCIYYLCILWTCIYVIYIYGFYWNLSVSVFIKLIFQINLFLKEGHVILGKLLYSIQIDPSLLLKQLLLLKLLAACSHT